MPPSPSTPSIRYFPERTAPRCSISVSPYGLCVSSKVKPFHLRLSRRKPAERMQARHFRWRSPPAPSARHECIFPTGPLVPPSETTDRRRRKGHIVVPERQRATAAALPAETEAGHCRIARQRRCTADPRLIDVGRRRALFGQPGHVYAIDRSVQVAVRVDRQLDAVRRVGLSSTKSLVSARSQTQTLLVPEPNTKRRIQI